MLTGRKVLVPRVGEPNHRPIYRKTGPNAVPLYFIGYLPGPPCSSVAGHEQAGPAAYRTGKPERFNDQLRRWPLTENAPLCGPSSRGEQEFSVRASFAGAAARNYLKLTPVNAPRPVLRA
jgi:hypothetical protein